MGWRLRSIRQRILLLVLVPVLSLIGLYIFATAITAGDAINLARTYTLRNAIGRPAGNFLGAIDVERPLAALYLAAPTPTNMAALKAVEAKSDGVIAALRSGLASGGTTGNESVGQKAAIGALLKDVNRLPGLREQVASGLISKTQAITAYSSMGEDADQVLNQTIRQLTSTKIVAPSLATVRIGQSEDMLLQEDALLLGDLAARSFPASDRQQFTQWVGARRQLYSQTLPDLDPQYRAYYLRYVSPQLLAELTSLENRVMNDPVTTSPPAVRPAELTKVVGGVSGGLTRAAITASAVLDAQATATGHSSFVKLVLAGGLGLIAVIVSILVSVRVGRGLVRELADLRESALELANKQLPSVVERLREGEEVDVSAEAPPIVARSDEIGQVRQAFATVQQTAVEAAVGQANLRRGISDIFRNLARRSQSLLHRQLALLDTMERRAKEPEELDDLFRIDHLTTRMRRHAESLIILSGDAPARGWRNPVPLVDVLRAAVAEVEDYTRIKVTATTRAALAGPAVGDIIHMIAELAENAAIFSPPNTPVLISGDVVGRGFAIEIEDRGLGLSDEKISEINGRLENPPPFDLSGSDQLGLFVASQLARRQNVKISLRRSPYGGTTAIVLIPLSLVVPEGSYEKDSAAGRVDDRAIPLTGRHAARDGDEPDTAPSLLTVVATASSPGDSQPAPANGRAESFAFGDATAWSDSASSGLADFPPPADPGDPGLPRRIRQANLAPQLRASGTRGDSGTDGLAPDAEPLDERSPDEARATMMAMQRGWERGRSIFDASAKGADAVTGPAPAGDPATLGDNESADTRHGDE